MLNRTDHSGVLELQLARPPVNALNPALITELRTAIGEAPANGARAVILSGTEGMFSAGLDVPELLQLNRPAMPHGTFGVSVQTHRGRDGGGEIIFDQVCGIAHVEAAEQQNRLVDPGLAQLQGFFHGGHTEPVDAEFGKSLGDANRTMSVSVGLNDSHHLPCSGKLADALGVAT